MTENVQEIETNKSTKPGCEQEQDGNNTDGPDRYKASVLQAVTKNLMQTMGGKHDKNTPGEKKYKSETASQVTRVQETT